MSRSTLSETAATIEASCQDIMGVANGFASVSSTGDMFIDDILDRVDSCAAGLEQDVENLIDGIKAFNKAAEDVNIGITQVSINVEFAINLRQTVWFIRALADRTNQDQLTEQLAHQMANEVHSKAPGLSEEVRCILQSVRSARMDLDARLRSRNRTSDGDDDVLGETTSPGASEAEDDDDEAEPEDLDFIVNDQDQKGADDDDASEHSSESESSDDDDDENNDGDDDDNDDDDNDDDDDDDKSEKDDEEKSETADASVDAEEQNRDYFEGLWRDDEGKDINSHEISVTDVSNYFKKFGRKSRIPSKDLTPDLVDRWLEEYDTNAGIVARIIPVDCKLASMWFGWKARQDNYATICREHSEQICNAIGQIGGSSPRLCWATATDQWKIHVEDPCRHEAPGDKRTQ